MVDHDLIVFSMHRVLRWDGSEVELPRPLDCICGENHARLVLTPIENHLPAYPDAKTFIFTCPTTGRHRVVGFNVIPDV